MVKNLWLLLLGVGLLVVALAYTADRLMFLSRAEHTTGTVISVSSSNHRCGGGRRRRSYPCTKYQADIQFRTRGSHLASFRTSAGKCRGSNVPVSCASLKTGGSAPVVYDPAKPSRAYIDTVYGVWAEPIGLFLGSLLTMVSSMFQRRKS